MGYLLRHAFKPEAQASPKPIGHQTRPIFAKGALLATGGRDTTIPAFSEKNTRATPAVRSYLVDAPNIGGKSSFYLGSRGPYPRGAAAPIQLYRQLRHALYHLVRHESSLSNSAAPDTIVAPTPLPSMARVRITHLARAILIYTFLRSPEPFTLAPQSFDSAPRHKLCETNF